MATIQNFEDLEIWQLSRVLCNEIYSVISSTPLKSDYKLKEQINGSSGSVMDNIAEGFERDGNKEFRQFLSIAKASCGETRSQLYRIIDRKYIDKDKFEEIKQLTVKIGNKIGSFMNYLKNNDFKGNKFK
ncbi:MAG TPA: four helix bundle protein [Flavobacteriaceae bacterium]|jgi:four helix bundle protein|nr:four helix bundle protein [Flavobacteriaceae bacterium]